MRVVQVLPLALLCTGLSGCLSGPTLDAKIKGYTGNVPTIDSADVSAYVKNNNAVLSEFAQLAGVKEPAANGEWRSVVDAGINYVDIRCDKFMDALFWLNRVRAGASRQINYTGTAVGAALAALNASKQAIGLTPLGFTLLDQTVNNLGGGLLYELDPSTVRTLVQKNQLAYIRSLTPSYTSKAIALRVIQGYAAICLPPAIEAEVTRAINAKEYQSATVFADAPPNAGDTTPNSFSFPPEDKAVAGGEAISNPIVVSGIGSPAPISVDKGEYQIVGSKPAWTSTAGTVGPGAVVQVRVPAPAAGQTTAVTLTIGGVKGVFDVATPATPPPAARPPGPGVAVVAPPPPPPPPAPVAATPVLSSEQVNGQPAPQ